MSFVAVIPARYASTRLPAKALADIGGKPMVVRVAERAARSGARAVWVATDHPAIEQACRDHAIAVQMTRADHPSGTDRLAEVAQRLALAPEEIVVNVQGDEPLIPPALVRAVADRLAADPRAAIATACHPIGAAEELFAPSAVKVVLDREGYALYFSRAPIPFARDAFAQSREVLPADYVALRHIGLYAYRASFLAQYASLVPCDLERAESLEQLRALWHGYRIAAIVVDAAPPPGVDEPADLERVRRAFAAGADV